jgi:hypothetical protein
MARWQARPADPTGQGQRQAGETSYQGGYMSSSPHNNSSENPCQRMKGFNGWKISWHFLSVGEFHFHRFWVPLAA